MEIPARVTAATVRAVKANNVEVLIFHPNTPKEAALLGLLLGTHIENQAAHFSQKLATHIVKFVMLLIESGGVEKDHLQEAVGQILHREGEEVSDSGEEFLALGIGIRQRNQV